MCGIRLFILNKRELTQFSYELGVSFCENLSVKDILKVRRRVQTRGMFGNLLNTLETPLP